MIKSLHQMGVSAAKGLKSLTENDDVTVPPYAYWLLLASVAAQTADSLQWLEQQQKCVSGLVCVFSLYPGTTSAILLLMF